MMDVSRGNNLLPSVQKKKQDRLCQADESNMWPVKLTNHMRSNRPAVPIQQSATRR